jgi:hypothetical protein
MELKKIFWILVVLVLGSSAVVQAETHAFPVPFAPSKGHTGITFTELPGMGTIKIFDLSGEIVTELPIAPGEILKVWNVTNISGKKLASGVYFYVIDKGNGERVSKEKGKKLVVIR